MPTFTLARSLWLLLLAIFIGGCTSSMERMENLDTTLRNYKKTIRWADFDSAYTFRKWQRGSQSAPPASLKNIRVTRYDVGSTNLSTDKLTYTQVVRISYYRMDAAREREVIDRQKWQYDEEKGHWFLVSDIPEF